MNTIEHSNAYVLSQPPSRVVSLVPSLTESIIDLGAGQFLVGITDFCEIPQDLEQRLERVGGTKTADMEAILNLKPDLVIANQEENSRQFIEALERADQKVWLTFPRSVEEAMELLWSLVRLFHVEDVGTPRIRTLETTLEWTSRAVLSRHGVSVFCPIWQSEPTDEPFWWMTFNQDTYPNDVLRCCGGINIFANRTRRYPLEADIGEAAEEAPGERDTRYPRVLMEEILAHSPEVILLPDEPYAFDREHETRLRDTLAETPAVRDNRVHLIDGSLITWHGTRMAKALSELPALLQP